MSYYFNHVTKTAYKNYGTNFDGSVISFTNQNDSTYILQIRSNTNKSEAEIIDYKNKLRITFDANFVYKNVEDLNKLSNTKLYTAVEFSKGKRFKNFREEFEFENDTVSNKKIVHLTQFKNKTSKKIINEHYYFFGKNKNVINTNKKALKKYLTDKYKVAFEEDENLERILHLHDGKIVTDTEILHIMNIDFNFNFKIDEVYPKHN